MSPRRAAPPAAEQCLTRAYASRKRKGKPQKGGTYVCGNVRSLEEHERRLSEDGYRPEACGARDCQGRLHRHGERLRTLRSGLGIAAELLAIVMAIAVFRCAKCGATWRVLPGFVARCLHREWAVVEQACEPDPSREESSEFEEPRPAVVPESTRRRWEARLAQAALVAVQALTTCGGQVLRGIGQAVGLDADRRQLIEAFRASTGAASAFASLAETLHRVTPGIRLM